MAPGVVEVPHRPDALNGVGAIQGGVLAFSAEQAAASLADGPVLAESLVIRYLRPFMVGPARAVATGDAALSVVHVTDSRLRQARPHRDRPQPPALYPLAPPSASGAPSGRWPPRRR